MIWQKTLSLTELNQQCQQTAVAHLGIEFTEIGEDYLIATMPIDHRTVQPFGVLHGGASALLLETLGSAAAILASPNDYIAVGAELNISHLKSIHQGKATGKAIPLHLGKTTQVWQVDIFNDSGQLCASGRLRNAIIPYQP